MNTWTPKTTLIAAGVAVLGVWYVKKKAGEAVDAAVEVVDTNFNPTKSTNLANRAANWTWGLFTDGEGTIGTDIADFVHDPEAWWN